MDILYQAIIENQKIRTDLLKWKLILSAALASIGFGTTVMPHSLPRLDVVLCCIPFVAAYVDLICSHMSLRVQVIGRFVRQTDFENPRDQQLHRYEQFVNDLRLRGVKAFRLESWAMYTSSLLLSAFLIVYGVLAALEAEYSGRSTVFRPAWFWLSGLIGVVLVLIIRRSYFVRYYAITRESEKQSAQAR